MAKKDTPDPPDYVGAAEKQAESSKDITTQQTYANRPNQVTPWGTMSWEASPTTDPTSGDAVTQWTQSLNLSPESQAALSGQQRLQAGRTELAEGLLGRAEQEFSAPMDWDALPGYGKTPDSSKRYESEAADAIYGQFSRRMEPQFQRDLDAQNTKLVNMGFQQGDEGYDQALGDLRTSQNDMRLNAMDQATIRSGQEAQRFHGMDMDTAKYSNAVRQQAMAEQMQKRGFSLNEINAILHGQQVGMPGMPDFMGATRSDPTQYLGATGMGYNASLDKFNAKQAMTQMLLEGASAFSPFSF